MKTLVIYQSKAGYTRTYAQWIAEELKADLMPLSRIKTADLDRYELLIYGGGLYVGGVNGVKKMLGMLKPPYHQKIFVFATGLSPVRPEIVQEVAGRNFTAAQRAEINFYYFRGGFDVSRLAAADQILMKIMKWTLQRKKTQTPEDKGMMAAFDQPLDFTQKEDLSGLISDARALQLLQDNKE